MNRRFDELCDVRRQLSGALRSAGGDRVSLDMETVERLLDVIDWLTGFLQDGIESAVVSREPAWFDDIAPDLAALGFNQRDDALHLIHHMVSDGRLRFDGQMRLVRGSR